MQQGQKVRDDVFDIVRDEHLVGIQMDAVFLHVHLLLQLGKVEDAGQVKWEIHVEVDVEQRILKIHRVQVLVEFLVVLIGEIGRLFGPGRLRFVHHKGDLHRDLLHIAFLVLGTFWVVDGLGVGALDNFHRHELAVGVQDLADARLFEVFFGIL